jgi:hypothetical protein
MRSVTLTRMRRGALVLAAAAVTVAVRMFSAAPAMADPLVITEPAPQPVMNETIFDNGLGLIGLDNGFVDFGNDLGFVNFDHDSDHAMADHDSDHAMADHDSGHDAKADRR